MSQSQALMSLLVVLGLFGVASAHAQNNSQALSPSELNRINNQPLAPAVSATGTMNTPEQRKPNYQYKDKNGTTITEYKDTNSPTQVDVKTPYTSYEMAPPTSVMPGPPKETDLISVPSISIPLR
jgi:energy-converting hydrogenase Eha subunit F